MFNDDVAVESAKLIPFSILRRSPATPPPVPTGPGEGAYARRQAVERLRRVLSPGSIVYVMKRWHHPDNDWLVCDFFRIDGHFVSCITEDIALAIDRYDPTREVGVKLHRPRGTDPLTVLIDGTLSRLLHGEPGAVQHVVIG